MDFKEEGKEDTQPSSAEVQQNDNPYLQPEQSKKPEYTV
jgi:hypothetical protein